MRTQTIIVATAVALAIVAAPQLFNESIETIPQEVIVAYSEWKQTHGMLFATPTEESYRLKVFAETYKLVKETNAKNLPYKFGLNKFSAISSADWRAMWASSVPKEVQAPLVEEGNLGGLPDVVDWEKKKRVAYPRDYSDCPNGVAFASTFLLDTALAIKRSRFPTRYSIQQMIDCNPRFSSSQKCSNTGKIDHGLAYLADTGLTKDSNYPIHGGGVKYKTCQNAKIESPMKATSYSSVPHSKSGLLNGLQKGPVASYIRSCDEMKNYQSGIFIKECWYGSNQFDMYALVVGYNLNEKYFRLRMPWGRSFGQKGDLMLTTETSRSDGPCDVWHTPRRIDV